MKERKRRWFGYFEPQLDWKLWGLGLVAGFNKWDGWIINVIVGPLGITWSTR